MLRPNPPVAELLNNRITAAIARHRKILFLLIALLYVLGFNGRWRMGLDSAHYRGLALNVASGNGYTFGTWAPKQVYPGLPYALAAVEYVFGPADRTPSMAEQRRLLGPSLATTASVLMVLAAAALTLVMVYRLIRLYYDTWVAVTITCGVGTNAIFLQHAHELLTDVPFLLGVVTSLYGWELLKRADTRKLRVQAIAVLGVGLIVAASLRPTFWVLAVCWVAVCVWGLIVGPRRFHAVCLVVLLAIWLAVIALDPRIKGLNPLAGGYEREAIDLLPQAAERLGIKLSFILRDQFPAAVFGEQLAPFSMLGSLVVLGATLALLRRHLLWVMMVFCTFAVTVVISAEPRYYTMVLPILLLAWLAMICAIARRLPRFWGEAILVLGLALVTLNNLSASVGFFVDQHHPNFWKQYKKGSYVTLLQMCEQIRKHTEPDAKILAPSGSIVGVMTGRHVYMQKELFPRGESSRCPQILASAGLDYAVFPHTAYGEKEPVLAKLMIKRILLPGKQLARVDDGTYLAAVHLIVPAQDWRGLPRDWLQKQREARAYKQYKAEKAYREYKARKAYRQYKQYKQYKLEKQRRLERRARHTTRPATIPSSLP